MYTEDNIQDKLALRDLIGHLRDTGMVSGGPNALGQRERQAFANNLDRIIRLSSNN